MAAAALIQPASAVPLAKVGYSNSGKSTKATTPLPSYLIEEAVKMERVPFDASKHLNFQYPKHVRTMDELGFSGVGISSTAVSEPFPLFTEEAIKQMRAEVFSQVVLDECRISSPSFSLNSASMIRGHMKYSPFIRAAWHSPELLAAVSKIAGVELVPMTDYDTGHVNISVESANGKEESNGLKQDDQEAFAWHLDSFAFVCVTMLSDCTNMVGGETVIRTGNGELMKVRGPSMGSAVVMQGRYLEHQALKARGGRERISMITSFRVKDPYAKEDNVLAGVRNISHVPTLYTEHTEYRLLNPEKRIQRKREELMKRHKEDSSFDIAGTREWLLEQKDFIEALLGELYEV